MKYNTIALLPLKLNSERIPGKNFKSFAGKPLFQWILDTLLSVDEIELVVINTDAKQALLDHGLVLSERIVIHERKPSLCGDFVSMNDILEDDLKAFEANTYVMTHTTNPLLKRDSIQQALRNFTEQSAHDSLFTVNKIQTRFYRQDSTAINHDPNNLIRTQDLEPWFEENSCLYIFTRDSFAKTNARIGAQPQMFVTSKYESVDIDEPHDWLIAEAIAQVERGLTDA